LFSNGYEDFHFRLVRVTGFDPITKVITTLVGDLSYDYLIIATGTKTNFYGNEQIKDFAFPLKRMRHALDLRSQLLQAFEQANMINDEQVRQNLLNIVITGAGPTGVELAGALAEMRKHILQRDYPVVDFEKMNIYLVEGLDRVLPLMSLKSSKRTHRYLQKMGIIIKLNARVVSYDGEEVRLHDGETIFSHTLIWTAGVTGILINGLPDIAIEGQRILVNHFNQVAGLNNVFAIGDIALMKSKKYPKGYPGVAQPAIQQGIHLASNFKRFLRNKPLKPFRYFDKGTLAIVGRKRAVADLPGNLHVSGFLAWITWLLVHIYYSIGFKNKLVVFSNWIYHFFTYQPGSRLIIRAFVREGDKAGQEFIGRYQEE
jgi:NADH dehydrogenase